MKLHPIFTSGMVFAAGKAIRIFGQGRGNITVYLNGETVNQICTCEKWLVQLPPMPEGGPYDCVIDMNGKRIVLQDVYILFAVSKMQQSGDLCADLRIVKLVKLLGSR